MDEQCDASVNLNDSREPFITRCGSPLPRDVCMFAERVVGGRCAAAKLDLGVAETDG